METKCLFRTLEREIKDLKGKLTTLLRKTTNDDNLINMLKTEVSQLKSSNNNSSIKLAKSPSPDPQGSTTFSQFQELQQTCAEQEDTIHLLETTISKLEQQITMLKQNQNRSSNDIKDNYAKLELEALAAELGALRIENTKLSELKVLLQSNMAQLETKIEVLGKELREEKRKVSILESANSKSSRNSNGHLDISESKLLAATVDMLRDENEALKTTLRSSQDNQSQEIQLYYGLLEQVKKHFQEEVSLLKRSFK